MSSDFLERLINQLQQHTETEREKQSKENTFAINDPVEGDYIFGNDLSSMMTELISARENGYPKARIIRLCDRKVIVE